MKKRGFTLIELLATIVIIAIISIITVPVINSVIEKSERNAFKDSVLGIMESGDLLRATDQIVYDENEEMVFNCDGEKCQDESGIILSFKGSIPIDGQLIVKKNGVTEVSYLKNSKYCALGERTNLDVQKDCSKLDITAPEIELTKIRSTTNEIIVNVSVNDAETGIRKLEYSFNGKTEVQEYDLVKDVNMTKQHEKLESGKSYTIVVEATNGNYRVSKKEIVITTSEIGTATVKFTNTPSSSQNGYLKSQTATLEYSGAPIENPYYYVKTTREASATEVTMSCGTKTKPETCSSITATTSLEENVWYRYTSIPTITYDVESDTNAYIYVAVGDGVNLTATANGTLSKIDTSSPELTLETATSTTKSISVPLKITDNRAGIETVTCKYGTKDGGYTTNATSVNETNCTISNINADTTYYYQVCVTDKVGNDPTCEKGNSKTSEIGTATVKFTNEPTSSQNGYLKSQTATLEYSGATIENPYYYVKTTREASATAATTSCGTGTVPGTCTSITSTTNLESNVWYRYTSIPTITYDVESDTNAYIYVAIGDGVNLTATADGTLSKIDTSSPELTLETTTSTTKSISVPLKITDNRSGIETVTCKYGTKDESYTTNATSVNEANCTISNVNADTTYYYQVCVTDKVGNDPTCEKGNSKTSKMGTVTVKLTNNPETPVDGYFNSQTATLEYSGAPIENPYYYVKTTRAAKATEATISCGKDTEPGTCSSITATTSLEENVWYRYTSVPTLIYDESYDTISYIYAAIGDGVNLTATADGTISKILSEANYIVNHYQMNVSGLGYTLKETETLVGTINSSVIPNVKTYEGFTSPSTQTITIAKDGSSTVDYYYTRNKYTVTVNKGTGIASVTGAGDYYYQSSVTVGYTLTTGYHFNNWTGDKTTTTFTMPASNVTMQANGAANTYIIRYAANTGSGSMVDTTCTYNENCTLRGLGFSKSGYSFNGWRGSDGGSYANGATVKNLTATNGGIITMYAKWTGPNLLAGKGAYKQYYYINSSGGESPDYNSMWSIFYIQVPAGTYYIKLTTGSAPRAKFGSTLVSNPNGNYTFTATTNIYTSVVASWAPTSIDANGYPNGGDNQYIIRNIIQ